MHHVDVLRKEKSWKTIKKSTLISIAGLVSTTIQKSIRTLVTIAFMKTKIKSDIFERRKETWQLELTRTIVMY
jgi:hypothetical protein